MQNLQLNVHELTGNEIIIREGDALAQQPPEKIVITGNINAVSEFLKGRYLSKGAGKQLVETNKALVIVDDVANAIELRVDPEDQYGAIITAKLVLSDELNAFGINTKTSYAKDQLVKLLRFNRLRFLDTAKHDELYKAAQAFSFKAEVNSGSSSDNRGNKSNQFEKKVQSDLPSEFILACPIFKGQEIKRFRVELAYDTTEGSVRFWFESAELAELIEIEKKKIFDQELKACEGFVIIRK